jgi:hypothetical protein
VCILAMQRSGVSLITTTSIPRLKAIFFSESQTMSSLTKFLLKIINIQNIKLISLDR